MCGVLIVLEGGDGTQVSEGHRGPGQVSEGHRGSGQVSEGGAQGATD